ncbi:MAG: CaiB/BaiF CoA-transferase family protein [Actinomycetota bacterium]|nr:CaiB/BaiF CoA-transferase family protein [Actinomycetota bacterium]
MSGPLSGCKVIELAGLGPGPFAAMLLADMGAEVIRVEKSQSVRGPAPATAHPDTLLRGRKNIAIDLKHAEGVETFLSLADQADVLLEGYRPGVMERLGIGPEVCMARNQKLIYGRMTGWGQEGPYAMAAGHDINYISLSGVLGQVRRPGERPLAPMNLVGDFGGGGMFLAFGVVCALFEAATSGKGQVVDTAMVDGSAVLNAFTYGFRNMGLFDPKTPGENMLDCGAHFYDTYECADGKFVSIGSIEPQFYAELMRLTGLSDDVEFKNQHDRANWPHLKDRLRDIFLTKTRAGWCDLMEMTDVCFAPVLDMDEALEHPHMVQRGTFVNVAGADQPAPAPRFSRTKAELDVLPAHPGQHSREILTSWGFGEQRAAALIANGAVIDASPAGA